MRIIQTNDALQPRGHYAQAIEHNGTVYISGILPIDHMTGEVVEGDVKVQSAVVFENLKRILDEAGTSLDKVLRTTVYIPDVALWLDVNDLYANFFGESKPCRTIVPTTALHYGSHIELEVIAYI